MLHIKNKFLAILIIVALWIGSLLILFPIFENPETYAPLMSSLDQRKEVVLTLTMSSSAASSFITALPEDVGTPVAEKLADISILLGGIFTIILAEKYMLPIMTCFGILLLLIVISFLLILPYSNHLKTIYIKIITLALVFILVIPSSILLSDLVEMIFDTSVSESINNAIQDGDFVVKEMGGKTIKDNRNIFQKGWDAITGFVGNIIDTIIKNVNKTIHVAQNAIGTFVEATAVLIVVNCIIPILVLLAYLKAIKFVFKWDFKQTKHYKKARERISKHYHIR